MMNWSIFGVYPRPPITPRPPALVTAAARAGPAATFIPARMTGCLIPKSSVIGVLSCCSCDIVKRLAGKCVRREKKGSEEGGCGGRPLHALRRENDKAPRALL